MGKDSTETEKIKSDLIVLRKENEQLRKQILAFETMQRSRRFQLATRFGNFIDSVFPANSIQRKLLKAPFYPIRLFKEARRKRAIRTAEKLISSHKRVYVLRTISWADPLKQRPHHLAPCLASKDTFVIYLDTGKNDTGSYIKISNDFIITSSLSLVLGLEKISDITYYFQFSSTIPISTQLLDEIKDNGFKLIYEYIDEIDEKIFGEHTEELLKTWNNIAKIKPELIIASAKKLFDEACRIYAPDKVLLSRNAAIVDDFDYHNHNHSIIPDDLAPILKTNAPIVGYYGAISPWLDYDLINQSAKDLNNYQFVFIGPDYLDAKKHLSSKLKNIHCLGTKKYNELPLYSLHFDCAIIPFIEGEVAKSTSPVKLYEFMAMGVPTVCTRDLIECYGFDNVFIAKNQKDFVNSIKKAVKAGKIPVNKENLLKDANNNSWQSRANDIIDKLRQLEK